MEEYNINIGMDYARLRDLMDWPNDYSRACDSLNVLPKAPRRFTGNKD